MQAYKGTRIRYPYLASECNLKWALLYLASYPETQESIRTEIGKLNEQKFFLAESDLPQTAVSKIY